NYEDNNTPMDDLQSIKRELAAISSRLPPLSLAEEARGLLEHVNSVLEAVPEHREELQRICTRLRTLLDQPVEPVYRTIEIEFYCLIESHPDLSSPYRLVMDRELANILKADICYYSDLSKRRAVTEQEVSRLEYARKFLADIENKR